MAEGGQYPDSGMNEDSPTSSLRGVSSLATLAKGKHVNMTVKNSSFTFVGEEYRSFKDPSGLEKYVKLVNDINKTTLDRTADKILQGFKTNGLQLPDFEVNPRMRKVEVHDYFHGKYRNVNDREITAEKRSLIHLPWKKAAKSQLAKEIGFHKQETRPDELLTLDKVLMSISGRTSSSRSKEKSVIGIVASAGSGKTTLMRRLARKSLSLAYRERGFEMIHFIDLKTVQYDTAVKPSKFLFGGLFKNEEDEGNVYQWLMVNQTKAILYFDGLDQATWTIDATRNQFGISPFTPADAATIMYNILAGNLLPQTKIVFASREFKVSELPSDARPNDIITISGLELDDAKKLFVALIGNAGDESWEKIQTMSPRLLNLISVPVFLILTAVVMARDPKGKPPTTVTGLYRRILAALRRVQQIRQHKKIDEIIQKLKSMAYRGMKDGRIVFYKEDFRKCGVSVDEVHDLIMMVPGNNLLSSHLIEGDFIFFFCHQSIQEFLAANFIVEMTFRRFSKFNKKHLHEERWSVIRRFVYGLVYETSSDRLPKIPDNKMKRKVLAGSIHSQLDRSAAGEAYVRMELYTAIYESDNEDLLRSLSVIDVSNISLNYDEAHIVGSLAFRSERLERLNLSGCRLDEEHLNIIRRSLKQHIEVENVYLFGNEFSETALQSLLRHPHMKSLSGNLNWKFMKVFGDFVLESKDDVIQMRGSVSGSFKIKESTLAFDKVCLPAAVLGLYKLFNPELTRLADQYMRLREIDLRQLSELTSMKMNKMLLDCTDMEEIDWSFIETSVQKYEVEHLDIAVDGRTPVDKYNMILTRGEDISHFGICVNIHSIFCVEDTNSVSKILDACRQKTIEYIRCLFEMGYHASHDDIKMVGDISNLKKVTLICKETDDMTSKVQKISSSAEFEILHHRERRTGAWEKVDLEFHANWRQTGGKYDGDELVQE